MTNNAAYYSPATATPPWHHFLYCIIERGVFCYVACSAVVSKWYADAVQAWHGIVFTTVGLGLGLGLVYLFIIETRNYTTSKEWVFNFPHSMSRARGPKLAHQEVWFGPPDVSG